MQVQFCTHFSLSIPFNLQIRIGVHPVPFWLDEAGDVEAQLEAAFVSAADVGRPVKALLLTNPNNPLGVMHAESTLRAMLRWAVGRGVHLVSDEIYALTVHTGAETFKSTLLVAQDMVGAGELAAADVDTHLHLLWGLSKDFGGSGLRLGVLWSRNAQFKRVMGALSPFIQTSNLLQHAVAAMLADHAWADGWIRVNQRMLGESYAAFSDALRGAGIPFAEATSAMFVWIDLRHDAGWWRRRGGSGVGLDIRWLDTFPLLQSIIVENVCTISRINTPILLLSTTTTTPTGGGWRRPRGRRSGSSGPASAASAR